VTATNGIQPGKSSTGLNPYFPAVKEPFTAAWPATGESVTNVVNGVTNVTYFDYVFYDGDYMMSYLVGNVLVRGNARVRVTDDINIVAQDSITITTNSSLQLYAGATNVHIGGKGVINGTGNATNFIYYGMPENTDLRLAFNDSFIGIIYAAQTRVTIGGGGNDTYDFIGAIVARSFRLNGHFRFHYDEALRDLPVP
jgi:hypothetical protein